MDNEVVIKIRVDDKSAAAGFAKAEQEIKARSKSIGNDSGKVIGAGMVTGAGKTIVGGLADSFREAAAYGKTALIGGVVAASPMIGAALSTAIIGAGGLTGIAGGVALAVRDPIVKSAGKQLGANLLSGLEQDARPFFTPVLNSIDLVQRRFESLRPTIQNIFKSSSGFLEPLVNSATRATGSILRGIEQLTSRGGPVMDSLGRTVEILGVSFEKAFTIISGGAEDAANANDQMAESLGSLIVVSAEVIRGLTKVASVIVDINQEINDAATFIPTWLGWMDKSGESATNAEPPIRAVGEAILSSGEAAGEAGQKMATYGEKMSDAANKGRGLFDAETALAESIRKATSAVKENGKGLGTNTEKQLDNRRALSAVARDMQRVYESYVTANGEGRRASEIAANQRARFVSLAMQFGKTAREANALADEMGLIKDKRVNFYANTHDAAGRISALKNQIASVKGKTVYINVKKNYDSASPGDAFAHGGIVGAAAGGNRSGSIMVGEYGPELIDLPPGSRVHSNADTQRVMRERDTGEGGVMTVRAVADRTTERGVVDAIFKMLRWEVANGYGGNVQLALGRN